MSGNNKNGGQARGRGRGGRNNGGGQGRGQPQQQSNPPANAWRQPAPAQQAAAPPQSAWGPPLPQGSSVQPPPGLSGPSAWGRPQQQQSQPPRQQPTPVVPVQPQAAPAQVRQLAAGVQNMTVSDGARSGERERRPRRVNNDDVVMNLKQDHPNLKTKKGDEGNAIALIANFFELKCKTFVFYKYHVDFVPAVESTVEKKKIMKGHRNRFPGGYVFDGTLLRLRIKLREDNFEIPTRTTTGIATTMRFGYVGSDTPNAQDLSQTLNIICRDLMRNTRLVEIRRNFFNTNQQENIPQFNISVIPGFHTSIRQHESQILLNVDAISRVQSTQTVYDLLRQVSASTNDYKSAFTRKILGRVVMTTYVCKTYRVDEVDFNSTPNDTFMTAAGPISYYDYYLRQYNVTIRDRRQPMLISMASAREIRAGRPEKLLLVPELCLLTGLDDDMRRNFNLMRELARHTHLEPNSYLSRIRSLPTNITGTETCVQVLRDWGINLSAEPVKVMGRMLPSEQIKVGNDVLVKPNNGDWTDALNPARTRNKFYTSANLKKWALVCEKSDTTAAKDFVKVLQRSVGSLGLNIADPQYCFMERDQAHELQRCMNTQVIPKDPELVMYLTKGDRNYAVFKKICYIDRAINSQVVKLKTISRPRGVESVATKIGIQINAKMGCTPWRLAFPMDLTMIVGFDVCHDTTNKSKSFGALVASGDMRTSDKYFSYAQAHENGEELAKNMRTAFGSAIRNFVQEHNKPPARIIFYRDGVGEGQLEHVKANEITDIQECINEMYSKRGLALPQFVFIVVTKRHSSRFITTETRNPPAGTVVDDVITNPERYDFLLVSQRANIGTASPTIYTVLKDGLGIPPAKMQQLANKMCHLYYNWSGTIRVPMVCQYAHRLAFLCGQHLHASPNPNLSKRLFYL